MVAFTRAKDQFDPRWTSKEMMRFYRDEIPFKLLAKERIVSRGGYSGIPPVLSNPTATAFTNTATIGVTTNMDNGTLYWVVSTNPATPSAAQILLGLDSTGLPATSSGHQPIFSGVFTQSANATGLSANTNYSVFFVQSTSNQHLSNIVSTATATLGPSLRFEISTNSMYLGGPS